MSRGPADGAVAVYRTLTDYRYCRGLREGGGRDAPYLAPGRAVLLGVCHPCLFTLRGNKHKGTVTRVALHLDCRPLSGSSVCKLTTHGLHHALCRVGLGMTPANVLERSRRIRFHIIPQFHAAVYFHCSPSPLEIRLLGQRELLSMLSSAWMEALV